MNMPTNMTMMKSTIGFEGNGTNIKFKKAKTYIKKS
jgi:hypothetical protein